MKLLSLALFVLLLVSIPARLAAQGNHGVRGADERFKSDVLVVVAHPDDEGAITPYLARAIYDQHKRVAVVYATRGGSGANDYSGEHGPALADIREIEARDACAKLGISNVWFLDGKDTASQNVLNSLANWGHGANLEKLVGLYRLTRPEVVITWLPGAFIGENHGDHQASGVLATEAYDLAADSSVFPAQVAGISKRLEPYLQNLRPWQVNRIYYFSDAEDQKQFAGTGPAYPVREISPSQKKPYWRIALEAAKPYLTQFPEEIQRVSEMSDDELDKMMSDAKAGWWTDPLTLIFGKSYQPCGKTDDVFAVSNSPSATAERWDAVKNLPLGGGPFRQHLELAGVWDYYRRFWTTHRITHLPAPAVPEVAVKSGSVVTVPLEIARLAVGTETITVSADVPKGWKIVGGAGRIVLPADANNNFLLEVETPALSAGELKKTPKQEIVVRAEEDGNSLGEVKLLVVLKDGALPQ